MAFVYENLTEQDSNKYPNINLEGLDGWYIDKKRDTSIWMSTGLSHSHPMLYAEHLNRDIANLRVGDKVVEFDMERGKGSKLLSEKPYIIIWDAINSYNPMDLHGLDHEYAQNLLKEALSDFGDGYFKNTEVHTDFAVQFNF